jgi:hypothetical protein
MNFVKLLQIGSKKRCFEVVFRRITAQHGPKKIVADTVSNRHSSHYALPTPSPRPAIELILVRNLIGIAEQNKLNCHAKTN